MMKNDLTHNQCIEILGKTGEKIISNFFSKIGKVVEHSINNFDSTKDMTVDGQKIEVKTQVPFVMKNAFTFKKNQLKKCLGVDKVIFVSVPNSIVSHYSAGKVYEIESSKLKYNFYITKDGRDMILIDINQPDMKELFQMSIDECKELQKYTVSSWK